jgi:crotonobetainyl-CoA:carnitine CoA-transferase CaiB-like acyl-CoA transferase
MLSGLRVLDLTDESGWLAGKILGDLGADVIKIEPAGGDREGRRPPFLHGIADPEHSLAWLALNTSKRGITLDLAAPAGRSVFARLVATADALLESFAPGTLDAWGIGFAALRRAHPRLVHCAMTPFGQTGPHAGFRARDLVVVAMGGNALLTGDPDRPPLRCSMPTAYYHAAPEAVLGILMALQARESSGRGDFVDVSLHECQLASLLGAPGMHATAKNPPKRSGPRTGRTREIWPVRDGHVSFGLRGGAARVPGLRALVAWMDEEGLAPGWLRDYDWERFRPEALDGAELARLEDVFGAFFAVHAMRELYEGALARRVLLAPCNDAREVIEQRQLRERGLFVALDYPELGAAIEHPAFFARSSAHATAIRRRAPRIGEHNGEIFAELGLAAAELEKLAAEGVT